MTNTTPNWTDMVDIFVIFWGVVAYLCLCLHAVDAFVEHWNRKERKRKWRRSSKN